MNTKNQWCAINVDLPDNDRSVLIYTYNYPDIMIGFYLKDLGRWSVCDKELDADLQVNYWMDLPEVPAGTDSFSFRPAVENMKISQAAKNFIEEDEGMRQLLYIQKQLSSAAAEGKDSCYIDGDGMTEKIVRKLEYAGYEVEPDDGSYLISW